MLLKHFKVILSLLWWFLKRYLLPISLFDDFHGARSASKDHSTEPLRPVRICVRPQSSAKKWMILPSAKYVDRQSSRRHKCHSFPLTSAEKISTVMTPLALEYRSLDNLLPSAHLPRSRYPNGLEMLLHIDILGAGDADGGSGGASAKASSNPTARSHSQPRPSD